MLPCYYMLILLKKTPDDLSYQSIGKLPSATRNYGNLQNDDLWRWVGHMFIKYINMYYKAGSNMEPTRKMKDTR